MKHESVVSSMIRSVGHDPEKNIMEVRFKNNQTYTYEGVTVEAYEALRDAESVGKHFNEHFRK